MVVVADHRKRFYLVPKNRAPHLLWLMASVWKGLLLMPKNRSPQVLRLMASVCTDEKAARDTCIWGAAVSADGDLMLKKSVVAAKTNAPVDCHLMPQKTAVDSEKKAALDAEVMGMKRPRRIVRILLLASFVSDE